ncbi:MAG: hypothetical protein KatS3mg096_014 [Candidatus Parcubacteria bacterium]|nr:MAG: hypothetical protein KatS3mg096_014 [Candidatus Parcubacteria bacterium]
MRSSLLNILNFILILVLALGIVVFLFWRLGILKQEAEISSETMMVKQKIEFLNNYNYQDLSRYFQNLSVVKIDIPNFSTEELGRPSLF